VMHLNHLSYYHRLTVALRWLIIAHLHNYIESPADLVTQSRIYRHFNEMNCAYTGLQYRERTMLQAHLHVRRKAPDICVILP
jgi:hypothetical protein